MGEQALVDLDHVLGVDEGHLDVELGEVGLAVGAQVLVAKAAGDLEVALEAADHQQLLEQLRRLGQGVEGPALEPARDEEVAGALGGGAGEHRGLDLDEALAGEELANRGGRPGGGARSPRASGRGGGRGSGNASRFSSETSPEKDSISKGGVSASASSSASLTLISTSPVGSFGLTVSGSRFTTAPAALRTSSARSLWPSSNAPPASSGLKTSWTSPVRSRRSMKIRPPWSRRRCTQPATLASDPTRSDRIWPHQASRYAFGRRAGNPSLIATGVCHSLIKRVAPHLMKRVAPTEPPRILRSALASSPRRGARARPPAARPSACRGGPAPRRPRGSARSGHQSGRPASSGP